MIIVKDGFLILIPPYEQCRNSGEWFKKSNAAAIKLSEIIAIDEVVLDESVPGIRVTNRRLLDVRSYGSIRELFSLP